jgi:phosphoribosylanthranilate isomerase
VVALLVDPDDARLGEVMDAVAPDLIQLHGAESPARVAEIARVSMRPVMKAVKVETPADAEAALDYQGAAELILFDAKAPKGYDRALPGGNGITFDWRAVQGMCGRIPFMLAGGLTPLNVAEAVCLTGAAAVDVSSGVESSPGVKDAELIRRFLHAAKTAKDSRAPGSPAVGASRKAAQED